MRFKLLCIVGLTLLTISVFGQDTQLNTPLKIRNQFLPFSPLLQLQPEGTALIPEGQDEIATALYKGNVHIYQYNNLNQPVFVVDGETTRFEISYRKNIGYGLELFAALPYVWNGPGILDNFTETWHGWFGLPNGGRELEPQDLFILQTDKLDIRQGNKGVGDPYFSLKKSLENSLLPLALKFSLQLPLSGEDFVGSGTLDVGLALLSDYYPASWLYVYGSLGMTASLGESRLKEKLSYDSPYSIQWALGFALLPFSSFSLFMQVFYQTSPYKSGYPSFDEASLVHSMGFRWKVFKDMIWQLSIDEDTFGIYHGTDYTMTTHWEMRF